MKNRRVKKLALWVAAVAAVTLLGGAAYGFWLLRWLKTPAFQEALLQRVRGIAGTDVRLEKVDVSLLSGVTLQGVAVANPPPFPGDLLVADRFLLRYRLRPLLAGRFEVERLDLARPRLAVAMDARGAFNYERLGRRRSTATAGSTATLPLRVVLSQLQVRDGSVVVTDAARAPLLALEGVGVESGFEVEGGSATGRGEARVRTIDVGHRLFVRDLRAPLVLARDSFTLSPIRGQAAGGDARGEATVRFRNGFHYTARVELARADVRTLLREAGTAALVGGALEGRARFEGTGGLATLRGSGEGRVAGCRVEDNRSLALLARLLGIPELASPDLDQCRVEFRQAGPRVTTPLVALEGRALHLHGKGTVNLETSALDYDLTLALSPALFAKVTRPELRGAFRTRPDGFATIDFRLTGTTAEPRTDLLARIGRSAAEETVRGVFGRLFGRKKER